MSEERIRQSEQDYEAGRYRPAKEALAEMRARHFPPDAEADEDPNLNWLVEYMQRSAEMDPQEQLWREARLALTLHDALDEIFPEPFRQYLDWSRAPDGEPWDTMKKLFRRYPTRQDCHDVEERIWRTAFRDMQIASAERRMAATEDKLERRRIAKEIEAMRREPITLPARPPQQGA